MKSNRNDENFELLYKCILSLDDTEECKSFLNDLCTYQELKAISQRLMVAKMLTEKKVYTEIISKTGTSTATISRVKRSLEFGENGYEKIFSKILKDKN